MLKGHKAVRVTFGICGQCKLRIEQIGIRNETISDRLP